jgi:PadR family transcriptional regulator, regulatory protein PadR
MMNEKFDSELLRGSLDIVVLSALVDGPKYGYLLQQRVRESSSGRVDLQAGTLYPLLQKLEADKLVRTKWDDSTGRRRKWYELTAAGQKQLAKQARAWCDYVECLRGMIAPIVSPKLKPS